jgi:hypothetical protein
LRAQVRFGRVTQYNFLLQQTVHVCGSACCPSRALVRTIIV